MATNPFLEPDPEPAKAPKVQAKSANPFLAPDPAPTPTKNTNPFLAPDPTPAPAGSTNPFLDTGAKVGGPAPFAQTEQKPASFADRLKSYWVDTPKQEIKELGADIGLRNKQANEGLKKDFTTKPEMTAGGLAGRALDIAGNVGGKVFAAPQGVLDFSVGDAANKLSGGKIDKQTTGDVAGIALPFAGEVMAEGKAAKAYQAAKAGPLGSMAKAVGKIASPATVDDAARAAANLHRQVLGPRGIEADKAAYELGKHQRVVGNASPADQLAVIRYVESRSKKGATISPKLKPAADAIKKVADSYRKQIEYVMGEDGPTFVKDYYARMWKQKPEDVERAIGGRQGSGTNLKARRLPTYEDGLRAGLTPRYPNPLDAMSAYADNMARFLGTHEILDGMKKAPEIGAKMFTPGQQPAGWVELKGMKTDDPARLIIKDGEAVGRSPKKVLYAPEGAARVYNNYISKGMESGDLSPIYKGARATANALVQLKLGLSAFHGTVIGQEGIISAMARGIKQASRAPGAALKGDFKTAGKELAGGVGKMAASPVAPIKTAMRGGTMKDQILGKVAPSEFDDKLNKIYARTGMRLGMDKIYATRKGTSLMSSAIRGTLKRDLGDALKRTSTGSLGDRAKGTIDLAGNLIQSTAAPLFEHYIPNMKRGAWSQQMADFLKANPEATEAEQIKYGQKLADSIDNRFGELVVNNNFWNKTAYQIAQMVMLSPSWNIGTVREIGGGALEIPKSLKGVMKGEGVTDKTAYVAALVGTTMAQNAVLTYLHTGEMPEGEDYFAYRTGGTDAATGKPERAVMPSYMKDVLAFTMGDAGSELAAKANPGLKTGIELAGNKDYKGQPIWDPNAPLPDRIGQGAKYGLEQATPIAFGDSAKPKVGSKLSGVERVMGAKPAPRYLTDPEGVKLAKEKRDRRAWTAKQKTDARMKAREQ